MRREYLRIFSLLVVLVVGKLGRCDQGNEVIVVDVDDTEAHEAKEESSSLPPKRVFEFKMDENSRGGNDGDPFVPTHEWQIIKPGQVIPKGIHVRLNLQTGEREGKLLDEKNKQGDHNVLSKQLEDALKNLDDSQLKAEQTQNIQVLRSNTC